MTDDQEGARRRKYFEEYSDRVDRHRTWESNEKMARSDQWRTTALVFFWLASGAWNTRPRGTAMTPIPAGAGSSSVGAKSIHLRSKSV
jgi:hypothetical protein